MGGEHLSALRDIIRPAHGRPYLGKLSKIVPSPRVGRFINLLSPQCSRKPKGE
jgi:hypothetical protein